MTIFGSLNDGEINDLVCQIYNSSPSLDAMSEELQEKFKKLYLKEKESVKENGPTQGSYNIGLVDLMR